MDATAQDLIASQKMAVLDRDWKVNIEQPLFTPNSEKFESGYLADRDKDVVFFLPNLRCWESMLRSSGFDRVERKAKFKLVARAGWKVPHVVNHAYKH